MNPRATRAACIVLVLIATLLSTPRASAGLMGRHTILGKVFRMTPVGRVVRRFEQRRDDYRAAQQWLDDQLARAGKRNTELKQLYRQRQIDTHTYVEARTLNERRKAEYTELKDRMTRITRDNFQRAMAQEVVDRLMPRILAHRKFQKTLGEVNEAFDTTRGFLEGGIAGIDRLAAKADLGFLGKAREATQRLIARIDKRELSGVLLADVKAELQHLDGRLAKLQQELPEKVKPEEVKQLQQQAREAAQTLQSTQNAINKEVQRVRDQGTIIIPVRSASRDKVVQDKLRTFRTDARMVDRAVATAKLRGEERQRVNDAIREAMDRLGIDRSDRSYLRLRKMAMEDLLRKEISFSDLSDDELISLWQGALQGARDRYTALTQGPAIGTVSMQVDYPPGQTEEGLSWSYYDYPGWMTWRSFGTETYPPEIPCRFDAFCASRLHLTIELLRAAEIGGTPHDDRQTVLAKLGSPQAFDIAFGSDEDSVALRYETWIYYDYLTALTFVDGTLVEEEPLEPVDAFVVAPAWYSPFDFSADMTLAQVQTLLGEGDLAQVSVPPELGQDMVLYAGEQIVVGFTAGQLEYVETLALQGMEETDEP